MNPSIGGVRPDKERSASQREDPIHLGAATRRCEGEIRRAKRRGQWAEAWEPRSGPALAETGRLNASERPSKVRNVKQAQEAGGLDQKVRGSDHQVVPLATVTSIPAGRKDAAAPVANSPSGNRVSPIRPAPGRKPDRKEG